MHSQLLLSIHLNSYIPLTPTHHEYKHLQCITVSGGMLQSQFSMGLSTFLTHRAIMSNHTFDGTVFHFLQASMSNNTSDRNYPKAYRNMYVITVDILHPHKLY